MAANDKPQPVGLKKIMKPVISSDVMGNRNLEVKAVGAWVEPAMFYSQIRIPDAVWSAQNEEEKTAAIQREKEKRLLRFQEDVKKRVRHMNKVRRKEQLNRDSELMEKQHQFVQQSLRSSEHLLGHKDHIMQQAKPTVSIKQPSAPHVHEELPDEGRQQRKVFIEHHEQLRRYTSQAREKLVSCKTADADDSSELSGGRWHQVDAGLRATRTAWGEAQDDDPGEDAEELEKFRKDEEEGDDFEKKEEWEQERVDDDDDMLGDHVEDQHRLRCVQFDLQRHMDDQTPTTVRRMPRKKTSRFKRPVSAPDLRTAIREEDERKRRGQQMLDYRRLYSDLERQTVRENERRRKQRSQIHKIKRKKEEWRRFEEDQARRLVEPRDPVTGETCLETSLREQLEQTHLQEVMEEQEAKRQKQREMARYLDALKNNLRVKLGKHSNDLPPLCCCGETVWDTHPDTCANNCFFYKNHRAYARALQTLLTSTEM